MFSGLYKPHCYKNVYDIENHGHPNQKFCNFLTYHHLSISEFSSSMFYLIVAASVRSVLVQFSSFPLVLATLFPHFHGLKIFGTKRTAIHNLNNAYYLETSDPDYKPYLISEPYPEKEAREKVIHSFINSILDKSKIPIVPQQDVYDVMSVCFAAEEAMDTGKTVKIEYLKQ